MGSANYWGGPVTTGSQHYARLFAERGWEVAYLSDPISPLHPFRLKSRVYNRDKFRLWRSGGRRDLDGRLFAYNHFTLLPVFNAPLLRSGLAVRSAMDLTVPNLARKLQREGFARPDLLWIDHLVQEGLRRRVDAGRLVYRMADDPRLFPESHPPALLRRLPALLDEADLVVVTARRLEAEARHRRTGGVLYLPNGVEYGRFAASYPEPEAYRSLPRPRVLYVGSLEAWFDAPLLERAAVARPGWSFVVVGPVRIPLGALRDLSNVHVLGPRPYEAVPALMAHADAGIIPFRRTAALEAVHPIKVYEYLAAGLPVVATDWEELRAMDAPITTVEGADAFIDALDAVLAHPGDADTRRACAAANSWSRRFQRLADALGLEAP